MAARDSLSADRCQEKRYVKIGRWGEWRACDKPAKHEVVATSWDSDFNVGDTIRVCGVHRRKHEQRASRDAEYKRKTEASAAKRKAAEDRANRLGVGAPNYLGFRDGYTGGVVLTADEADRLLKELGR